MFCFLIIRRPPRSTRTDTLCPSTTLFRSHSLRAVTSDELAALLDMSPAGPVHIHAAEQVKEVADCVAWSGARPVEWLLDNAGVDERDRKSTRLNSSH